MSNSNTGDNTDEPTSTVSAPEDKELGIHTEITRRDF